MRGLVLEPEDEAAADFQEARNYHHAQQISTSPHNIGVKRSITTPIRERRWAVHPTSLYHHQSSLTRMSSAMVYTAYDTASFDIAAWCRASSSFEDSMSHPQTACLILRLAAAPALLSWRARLQTPSTVLRDPGPPSGPGSAHSANRTQSHSLAFERPSQMPADMPDHILGRVMAHKPQGAARLRSDH